MNKFILAITTFNRLEYLKTTIDSWIETKNSDDQWSLLVADDGSDDGTLLYLEELKTKEDFPVKIISNNRRGVHFQTNSLLKSISELDFDLCFKTDDDVKFIKGGWEKLYLNAIAKTGYDHLSFYDLGWNHRKNKTISKIQGPLISHCDAMDIQGAFFTLTKEVIQKVGYFDCINFGLNGMGHIDYSWRCARLGFNDLKYIYDVKKSNNYIRLQAENYRRAVSPIVVSQVQTIQSKTDTIKQNRGHIAYNEITERNENIANLQSVEINGRTWRYANTSIAGESSFNFFGQIIKRFYNWNLSIKSDKIPVLFKDYLEHIPVLGRHFKNIDI